MGSEKSEAHLCSGFLDKVTCVFCGSDFSEHQIFFMLRMSDNLLTDSTKSVQNPFPLKCSLLDDGLKEVCWFLCF